MTRIYAFLAVLAGFALMVAKAFAMGRESAKDKAELTEAKGKVVAYETRNEIERGIASGGDAVSELRDKWKRK